MPPAQKHPDKNAPIISKLLLGWYDRNARELPWRIGPHSAIEPDPYHVWLSEIMLQQTTVAAVKPYFTNFLGRWPTVQTLARASNEDVMAAWAGLGYYARARNLHRCAIYVTNELGGEFPRTESELLKLPGVGAYTAAAIAAIAFGERAVVVDANVERVVARLFAVEAPLPSAKKAITKLADTITPETRAGDFAQAMMDLGATVCTSKSPQCLICPLTETCAARKLGIASDLPRKVLTKSKPQKQGWAWWIEQGGNVFLVRRPDKGMLGGMAAFPGSEWSGDALPRLGKEAVDTGSYVQHSFTHFDLKLHIARVEGAAEVGDGWWFPVANLDEAGLPTLFKKVANEMKNKA